VQKRLPNMRPVAVDQDNVMALASKPPAQLGRKLKACSTAADDDDLRLGCCHIVLSLVHDERGVRRHGDITQAAAASAQVSSVGCWYTRAGDTRLCWAERLPKLLSMPDQVVCHKGRNEIIAVVVSRLHTQSERDTGRTARLLQKIRTQLFCKKLICFALIY